MFIIQKKIRKLLVMVRNKFMYEETFRKRVYHQFFEENKLKENRSLLSTLKRKDTKDRLYQIIKRSEERISAER